MKKLTLRTLDAKAAKFCKAPGRCERCGSTQNLEWSHDWQLNEDVPPCWKKWRWDSGRHEQLSPYGDSFFCVRGYWQGQLLRRFPK